jgi:hypothetical protein
MISLASQVLRAFCVSFITLVIFGFVTVLQNLPMIFGAIQTALVWFIYVSENGYRKILTPIMPNLIQNIIWRLISTTILSILLCGGLTYLIASKLNWWPLIIALIHGLIVGICWERSNPHDQLNLGVNQ